MKRSVAVAVLPAHLLSSEIAPTMLKADLRNPEIDDFRAAIGRAIETAYKACGWNLDEFSEVMKRDSRQIARWISGAERPQFDVLFAVERLRGPLVIALAGLAHEIEVVTEIRVRRSA